ncbi:MAG: response regulator [Candidatus Melainabacteria bacterium]|nr:response regulator [Candidatus Melainabacteria bacterium]
MVNTEEQAISLHERKAEGKPIVLIVDDNPEYARLFELLADRLGIAVHVVNSCADAIEALQLYRFDIIIMDWVMPDVDGPTCTRKIRIIEKKTDSHTAVIGISGHENATYAACIESGMDDYLKIPFTLEELNDKLTQWLEKRVE